MIFYTLNNICQLHHQKYSREGHGLVLHKICKGKTVRNKKNVFVFHVTIIISKNKKSTSRCIPHSALCCVGHRGPSVTTLRSPLSAEFWRQCVLNGETQRCVLNFSERANENTKN